ncbi:MAG: A/G-specific adenine glycosylase [Verrucomicrobia bacterium]|nr:A/G-specific adenine glycosylase [Verrucomicrobiota bacterium]
MEQLERSTHKIKTVVNVLLDWFATNARDLPWRRTTNPYAIWVSEIMLQQTQVKTVIPYWQRWMRKMPTIAVLAKARPEKIHKLWEGLGYYTRVRNMQQAAQQIISQYNGKFPKNFDDILSLPGVGRYTAGAISSIAFNQSRPILDGNVIRVLTRVFAITTDPRERKTNAQLWRLAEELVLHASRITHHVSPCSHLNQSLMELGALVCTPRSPLCGDCPLTKSCIARKKNLQETLPNLGKREASTARRFVAFVVERSGRFLVRQRPAGVVNAHLWEFPNVEIPGAPASCRPVSTSSKQHAGKMPALPGCDFHPISTQPLCTIRHSITRYRITLDAWRAELTKPALKDSGSWLEAAQLRELAFTAAHKKILGHIMAG